METIDDINTMKFWFQVQAHSNVNMKVKFNVDMKICTLTAARDDEETIVEQDVESDAGESMLDSNITDQLKPTNSEQITNSNDERQIDKDTKQTPTANMKDFEYVERDGGTQCNYSYDIEF